MADLTKQRDKFLAFAFAASDILFEADLSGRINFATGTVASVLGYPAEELLKNNLVAMAPIREGPMLAEALFRISQAGKIRDVPIILCDKPGDEQLLFLSGIKDPFNPNNLLLAIRCADAFGSDLGEHDREVTVDKDKFVETFTDTLTADQTNAVDFALGVCELPMDALQSAHGHDAMVDILAEVEACLATWSAGGGPIGDFGEGRYGMALEGHIDPKAIAQRVATIIDAEGIGAEVNLKVVGLEGDIPAKDLRDLISHVVDEFRSSGCDGLEGDTLLDFEEAMLAKRPKKRRKFQTEMIVKR